MHTAPGPAGAARGHEKEFSRYLDSTARRSISQRSRGGRRSPGALRGGSGRGRRSGAPSAAHSARWSLLPSPVGRELFLRLGGRVDEWQAGRVHFRVGLHELEDPYGHVLDVPHGFSPLRNGFSVVDPDSSALPPTNFEISGWIRGMIAVWNQGDSKNRRRRAGSISLSFAAQSGFQASIASMTGPRMPSTMTPCSSLSSPFSRPRLRTADIFAELTVASASVAYLASCEAATRFRAASTSRPILPGISAVRWTAVLYSPLRWKRS